MEFTTAPIPTGTKRGRPALPNPFTDRFPTPDGECVQVFVPGLSDSPEVKRLTRQARQAAKDKGLTAHVRVDFDPNEDSEEGELTVFRTWTTPKASPASE